MAANLSRQRKVAIRAGLLFASVLSGALRASAAPPPAPATVSFANALWHLSVDAQGVAANSRKFERVRAAASKHVQAGSEALQELKASETEPSYLAIYSARDEFQAALEDFERLRDLGQEIAEGLRAMETALDSAKARVSATPSATTQLERASELLASTRLISQPATRFVDSELSPATDAANAGLHDLAAMEQALREAHRKYSTCDIHNIGERSFEYPRSIVLFLPYIKRPMFNADNGGYVPHPPLYADLDGNGQVEAIVQLTRGATTPPVSDCSWRGQGAIFVFEMDEKCVVHRLAWIKGSSLDRQRLKGKTLFVDQPRFTSSGDKASCKQVEVAHVVWQFKAGKLLRL